MVSKVEDDRVFEKIIGFELLYDLRNLLVDGMHPIVVAGIGVAKRWRVRMVGEEFDIPRVSGESALFYSLASEMKGTFV